MVALKIRDIAKVGDIIDALTAAGANNISGISFEVSEIEKLLDQARAAAFADAKRKAELYAKAAGRRSAASSSIAEQEADMPRPAMMARARRTGGARRRPRSRPAKSKSAFRSTFRSNCRSRNGRARPAWLARRRLPSENRPFRRDFGMTKERP